MSPAGGRSLGVIGPPSRIERIRLTASLGGKGLRAQLRVIVKRILRKYSYPPDSNCYSAGARATLLLVFATRVYIRTAQAYIQATREYV